MILLIPAAFILLLPMGVLASVGISEVAWMGSEVSAADEWIELHNVATEPVSVEGWWLRDGGSLEIALAGTIGAGQFVVLERTNDDSAPSPAFLIYTGALKNSGATLTLMKADGTVVDVVEGGVAWERIGGSNETKATAQRTENGWVTAPATPGTPPPLIELLGQLETASDVPQEAAVSLASEGVASIEEGILTGRAEPAPLVHQTSVEQLSSNDRPRLQINWPYVGLLLLLLLSVFAIYGSGIKDQKSMANKEPTTP